MPYHVLQPAPRGRPTQFLWYYAKDQVDSDAKIYPWLQLSRTPFLCFVCGRLDFQWLFSNLITLQRLVIDGQTLQPIILELGPVARVRQYKDQGCPVCSLIWNELCHQFSVEDLPDKHPNGRILHIHIGNVARNIWSYSADGDDTSRDVIELEVVFDNVLPATYSRRKQGSDGIKLGLLQIGPEAATKATVKALPPTSHSVDFKAIQSWLSRCRSVHPGHAADDCPAARFFVADRKHQTHFIDTEGMCIVEGRVDEVEYAALSYCWGRSKSVLLLAGNKSELSRPNGLAPVLEQIPRTIRDAISLCEKMSIRYLWVDGLCIIQDDGDKIRQIGNIHLIYANTLLTIVAAHGKDADAGLPGLYPNTRKASHHIRMITDKTALVNVLQDPESVLNQSVWNTRGWTYQERLISEQMLVFTEEQLLFYCRHGYMTESSALDLHAHPDKVSCSEQSLTSYSINVVQSIDLENYAHAVQEYSQRQLTSSDDVLNAFQGLLQVIRPTFTSDAIYFGLPLCVLDLALLWRPTGGLARRTSDSAYWPSWSWVGWIGAVEYFDLLHLAERTISCLEFTIEETDSSQKIQSTLPRTARESEDQWTRCYEDGDIYYTKHDGDPDRWHCRPGPEMHLGIDVDVLLGSELRLKADIASFHILVSGITEGKGKLHGVDILDTSQKQCGTVHVDGNTAATLDDRAYRFVCLSRSTHAFGDTDEAWDEESNSYAGEPGARPVNPDCEPPSPAADPGPDSDPDHVGELFHRFDAGSMWFDAAPYDLHICWPLYNVLMIDDKNERLGIGKIHVHAFDRIKQRGVQIGLR